MAYCYSSAADKSTQRKKLLSQSCIGLDVAQKSSRRVRRQHCTSLSAASRKASIKTDVDDKRTVTHALTAILSHRMRSAATRSQPDAARKNFSNFTKTRNARARYTQQRSGPKSLDSTKAVSSQHPRGHARHPRNLWRNLLRGCRARRSPNSTSTTRTTCCGRVRDTPDHLDMSRWSESR